MLKLQIFVLDLSEFGSGTEKLEGSRELIELKKKELEQIQKEIANVQHEKQKLSVQQSFDKEEDKLYNNWLGNIKKKLK